jgi:hypothetical protein
VEIRRCWNITFRVIAKNQANKIPYKEGKKIGPPGENTEVLILKEEN